MFKEDKNKKQKEENKGNNPFTENEEIKEEQIQEETVEETQQEKTEDKAEIDETEKLKAEIEDMNNKYLRLAADFDNYRKRQAQEREDLLKYGAVETLKKLIPVLDTIERAKVQIDKLEDVSKVKESYEVILKQFTDILDKCGLEKMNVEGEMFDPNLHEAVAQVPTNEMPEGTIVNQMQTGYKTKDKILRPAMVSVAVSEGGN